MTFFVFRGAKSREWTFCDPINVHFHLRLEGLNCFGEEDILRSLVSFAA